MGSCNVIQDTVICVSLNLLLLTLDLLRYKYIYAGLFKLSS